MHLILIFKSKMLCKKKKLGVFLIVYLNGALKSLVITKLHIPGVTEF